MKISKAKLRQIIKEELSSLSENNPESSGPPAEARAALERIWNVINEYEGDAASVYERAERILPRIEKLATELEYQYDMAPQSDVDKQMDADQAMMDDPEGSPWQEDF